MEDNKLDFLMGALSPTGFCGYYSQILKDTNGTTAALLKAAPGCGKSTLLKRIAAALLEMGETVELIHCSADPSSLDGVICKRRKFSIVDATAPHTLEPEYPVAFEDIIPLYGALNRDLLQHNRKAIVALFKRYKCLQERATRYITAAGSLLQDTMRVAQSCTDTAKATAFAEGLSRKYLPHVESGEGSEEIRLLSAITLDGQIFYTSTIKKLSKTLIVLDDEFGAASKTIMHTLRQEALKKGHEIITCYCSMSPYDKIEHIFVPKLGVGFVTSNDYHSILNENARIIHCLRFCEKDAIKAKRKRLRFNKKAIAELFAQASLIQAEAKACHDELESYYISALDFSSLDVAFNEIINRLN